MIAVAILHLGFGRALSPEAVFMGMVLVGVTRGMCKHPLVRVTSSELPEATVGVLHVV